MVEGGQRHAPATLPPGKTRYPLYRRLGSSQKTENGEWPAIIKLCQKTQTLTGHSSARSSPKNALLQQCSIFRCGNEAVASFQMAHPASRNSDHKTTDRRLFVGLHTHFIQLCPIIRCSLFVSASTLPVAVPGCCLFYVPKSAPLQPCPSHKIQTNARS
jgi:hypothetical protein